MELLKNQGKGIGRAAKGLTAAFLVSAVLLLAFAFLLLKFKLDDEKTGIGIFVIYALSCAAGGWYCGRKAEKRRFLWGLLIGTLYFALLFTVSALSEGTPALAAGGSVPAFLLCALGGMAGGMIVTVHRQAGEQ